MYSPQKLEQAVIEMINKAAKEEEGTYVIMLAHAFFSNGKAYSLELDNAKTLQEAMTKKIAICEANPKYNHHYVYVCRIMEQEQK